MLAENFLNLLIVLFLFFLVFGLAEILYKRKAVSYVTRKVVHIGGSLVTASLPFFVELKIVVILGIGFFLLLVLTKRKKLLQSIHDVDDDSIGALLFAPSLVLTAIIFWNINTLIFQGATLILGLSDGGAGIIGKRFGKNTYRVTGTKTIEGSTFFFLVTFIVLFSSAYVGNVITFQNMLIVFGSSLVLTIIEAIFGRGWDNLFIPLASGIALYLIV
jgi:dolichol kinase